MQLEDVSRYKGKSVTFNGGKYLLIGMKKSFDGQYSAKLLDERTRNCVVWARLDAVRGV